MRKTRRFTSSLLLLLAVACYAPPSNLTGDPLSPEVHRAKIVAVEAVLFEDGPLGEAERRELSETLLMLAGVAESDAANTIATALGRDLRMLAAQASRAPVGKSLAGSQLRQQWMRIRGSLFDDAAWYRWSSADPIEPAIAGPPPPSALRPATLEERKGLNLVIFSLTLLLERARQDLPNENGSEDRLRFGADVLRELAIDVERLGPALPVFEVDNYYRAAHQSASEAIRNLDTLARLGVGAPTSSREYAIRKAEQFLAKARADAREMMPQK